MSAGGNACGRLTNGAFTDPAPMPRTNRPPTVQAEAIAYFAAVTACQRGMGEGRLLAARARRVHPREELDMRDADGLQGADVGNLEPNGDDR
jgi:hypothetical protein